MFGGAAVKTIKNFSYPVFFLFSLFFEFLFVSCFSQYKCYVFLFSIKKGCFCIFFVCGDAQFHNSQHFTENPYLNFSVLIFSLCDLFLNVYRFSPLVIYTPIYSKSTGLQMVMMIHLTRPAPSIFTFKTWFIFLVPQKCESRLEVKYSWVHPNYKNLPEAVWGCR